MLELEGRTMRSRFGYLTFPGMGFVDRMLCGALLRRCREREGDARLAALDELAQRGEVDRR